MRLERAIWCAASGNLPEAAAVHQDQFLHLLGKALRITQRCSLVLWSGKFPTGNTFRKPGDEWRWASAYLQLELKVFQRYAAGARSGSAELQASANAGHDLLRRLRYIFDQRGGGFLERRQLAGHQALSGKMMFPRGQIVMELFRRAAKIDQLSVKTGAEEFAIRLPQRGARKNDVFAGRGVPQKLFMDGRKPGKALRLRQRNAYVHLPSAFRGVKVVGVKKGPRKLFREQRADRGFARAGDTHHENDHGELWH